MNPLFSRRNVLRGAGVCLALPWLESLAPRGAQAQAAAMPKRYVPIFFPCGAAAQWWDKAPAVGTSVTGDAFQLSLMHEPLMALKAKLLILSRIGNYSWNDDGTPGVKVASHARCPAALLTCVNADKLATAAGMDLPTAVINGVTADQVIVQKGNFASLTPLGSMQVGCGSFPGAFDGRSYSYNQVMSWKSEKEPLKRMINPKAVFDAMVMAGAKNSTGAVDPAADAAAAQRAAENKSVLDAVLENAGNIKPRLGKQDQATLEQFMSSFRDIEKQVTTTTASVSSGCQVVASPMAVPEPGGAMQGLNQGQMGYDRAAHVKIMNDLVVMALQCDVTRIITYMLDDSRSEFNYTFIPMEDQVFGSIGGIDNYHGGCQHGPGMIPNTITNGVYGGTSNGGFATVGRWWVRQVADLASKLDAIPEGDGTVLDHTLLHMASDMRTHDHKAFDLPMLLLGGKGFIKQNAHVALAANPSDRQARDLYYTIQKTYFGLSVDKFGDGPMPNALIEEILA
ncbi:MAG TPA: DUF1552 domain-containing protein [Polyangiaceae bacterium]|nr:DUF1552 domain-containing protein [Polyangiaceae bacterium]